MKHVILATDFSDNAWRAMSFAANLYSNVACHYHILTCSRVPYQLLEGGIPMDAESIIKENEKSLDDLLIKFMELNHQDSTTFTRESRIGLTIDCINNEIRENGDEYSTTTVIGSHGASGLVDKILGTTSSDILLQSDSPVLCIPQNCSLDLPKKIMLATDGDIVGKTNSLKVLAELVKLLDAELLIVNVKEGVQLFLDDSAEKIIADHFFKDVKHSYHTLEGNSVSDELVYFSNKEHIDMITLLRRDDKFFTYLFKDSNIKSLNFYGNRPILAV